jgi:hypothetical protein
MRSIFLVLIGLACTDLIAAQTVSFSGPVEAFAFDLPTRSVRAVMGVPGSSSFGPAIVEDLDFGSVAPQQNYAVVLRGLQWQLAANLDSSHPSSQLLSGITSRPQGIAWSGDGSLAILYSPAGNWIQTIGGLPKQPAVGPRTDVSSLGGVLAAVASDSAGKHIAVAIAGQRSGVFLFEAATQAFVPVLALSKPIALAFSSDGTDLLAIDASTRQLSVVNLTSLSSQTVSLDGLAEPFAVGSAPATSSSRLVYIASRSDQILREYDLSTQQTITDLRLNFVPTGFQEFGRNSFLVASRALAAEPLWLFVDAPQPAVYFVPALPAQTLRPERGEHGR